MGGGLLRGIRIVDLGEGVSAPYAARTLAWLGADVLKIEPPRGDRARRVGASADGAPNPEKSALFLSMNAGKRGAVVDADTDAGRRRLLELASDAAIVIDNHPLGWLEERGIGYERLAAKRDDIILTQITPFGSWGPYSEYDAGDLSLFHMSANAHGMLGPVERPDSEPPIRAGGRQADLAAGAAAATATLAALYRLRTTGRGCHIVVSAFEAMATQAIAGLANIAFGAQPPTRKATEAREASIGGQVAAIGGVLPCSDGYVAISPREDAQWARWLDMMGNPDWADDERFATRRARQRNSLALWELLADWTRQRSRFDIAREGQRRRVPCFPVNTVADLLTHPHLEARRFFVPIDHPAAGRLRYPSVAYKLSRAELPIAARAAPTLGSRDDDDDEEART